jgi:hypothetical protein
MEHDELALAEATLVNSPVERQARRCLQMLFSLDPYTLTMEWLTFSWRPLVNGG